jgi:hypothetical protein
MRSWRSGARAVAVAATYLAGCSSEGASKNSAMDATAEGGPQGEDAGAAEAGGAEPDEDAACAAPCDGQCIGGRCLVTLASIPSPVDIVVDTANAYVSSCATDDGGMVLSVPLAGGTPRALAAGPGCPVLALAGTTLYLAGLHGGDVASLPSGGGPLTTLVSGADAGAGTPVGIAVDATSVYWTTTGGAVMKAPRGGGSATSLASGQTGVTAPAVDASGVYWGTGETINKAPLDGGPTTVVTTAGAVTALAIAGNDVYFAAGYLLMKAPLGGGPSTGVSAADGAPLFAVAIDDANAYFTSPSVVYEVPLEGGNAAVLASNQGGPNALALNATGVYWTDGTSWPPAPGSGGGQVVKLTPK